MAVAEDDRRRVRGAAGGNQRVDEWALGVIEHGCFAASAPYELDDPVRSRAQVVDPRWVGADARDSQELG